MRVTRNMMLSNMMTSFNTIQSKLLKNQQQISESRRILTPSDDPIGASHVLLNRAAITKNEQYQKNAQRALNWMETTESVLDQLQTLMSEVDVTANRGATDTFGSNERHAFAEDITNQLDNLLKFARTTYNGRYIFGGHQTIASPYESSTTIEDEAITLNHDSAQYLKHVHLKAGSVSVKDANSDTIYEEGIDYTVDYEDGSITAISSGSMADGGAYTVNYETKSVSTVTPNADGSDGEIKYQIGNDVDIQINVSGSDVFENEVDMFNMLIDLRNKLERDDIEGIQGSMADIKDSIAHITKLSGEIGTRVNRITMTNQFLENEHVHLETINSQENDLDVTEAMMQMQALTLAYQTSQTANAQILQLSLVNLLNG